MRPIILLLVCSVLLFSCVEKEVVVPASISNEQVPYIDNGSYMRGTITTRTQSGTPVQFAINHNLLSELFPYYSQGIIYFYVVGADRVFTNGGTNLRLVGSSILDTSVFVYSMALNSNSHQIENNKYFLFNTYSDGSTPEENRPKITNYSVDTLNRTVSGNISWEWQSEIGVPFTFTGTFKIVDIKEVI